jgi:predicted ATPase/DNA-binding SARP family transcriptional activator
MLTLAVLGPVALQRDGVALPVPGGKTVELLVRLALEAGNPVRAERLLDELWPQEPSGASLNTLQSKVSRLRGALGDGTVLTKGDAGYTLALAPDHVDALAVPRLAKEAAAARDRGDPERVVEWCDRALALFHGDVLPAVADAPWAQPYRQRLTETRLDLTQDRLAARLDLGGSGELVSELEELVAAHPLREHGWILLVTTLVRAGRQGDALAACARVRGLLARELGIDPGPQFRLLEEQVLRQDPALLATARPAAPAAPTAAGRPTGNLPTASGPLIGRAPDLEQVGGLLMKGRLVTVTGPAGVGKSRLAVAVAWRSHAPGGAWLAHVETATDTASVWTVIGDALAVDAPTPAAVMARVRAPALLLVLDGCEHLADAVAEVVTLLLESAPQLQVIATSQVPLHVGSEAVLELAPLGLADAVALFTDRSTEQRPHAVGEDAESQRTVEEVCRALDGLPLAIELAAARTRVLPVSEIARRLDDRFALLRDPTRNLPARQTTLRAALTWSYDLLFPDDQRGLWAIASCTGGAPLPAVETVLTTLQVPADAALDVVARLVDRSLATAEFRSRGPVRYRLLDSVRELARERLQEAGLADAAAAAHAHWFADAADRAHAEARGPRQREHLDLARTERANIDAALSWCVTHDPALGVRIALGFGWTWVMLGTGVDGAQRVRRALDSASAGSQQRARALILCGWFEASGGNLHQAVTDLEEAITLGDEAGSATARLHLAFIHTQGGRAPDALTLLDRCRPQLAHHGLTWEEGTSWLLAAWAHITQGDFAAGEDACRRALAALKPLADGWALAHAEGLLGELALGRLQLPEAVAHLTSAAHSAGTLGFEAAQAHHLLNLGRAELQSGDVEPGRSTLERAIHLAGRCGDARTAASARTHLAQLLCDTGETAAALAQAEQAASWFDAAGGGDGAAHAAELLADLRRDLAT